MNDIIQSILPYVALSKPIPFNGIYVYPITVDDYYNFMSCCDILTQEKNKIADVKIIQMSYLQFIFEVLLNDTTPYINCTNYTNGQIWEEKIIAVLTLTLKLQDNELQVRKNEKGKFSLNIKGKIFDAKQFDTLRKIIMYQNIVDYDDEEMSDDYKRVVEEYYRLKNKGIKMPELENKIDTIIAKTSYKEEEILKMTYRRFEKVFSKIIDEVDYKIFKIAEMQGSQFKQPIEHWIYKPEKEKYSEVFSSAESFIEKVQ